MKPWEGPSQAFSTLDRLSMAKLQNPLQNGNPKEKR